MTNRSLLVFWCVRVGEGGARVSVLARARGWLEGEKKKTQTQMSACAGTAGSQPTLHNPACAPEARCAPVPTPHANCKNSGSDRNSDAL